MGRHAAAAARDLAPSGLAVTAVLLLAVAPTPWTWIGYASACLAVAVSLWRTGWRPAPGADLAARLLLAAGVVAVAAPAGGAPGGADGAYATGAVPLVAAAAPLLAVLLAEPLLHRLARPWYAVRHLSAPPSAAARAVDGGLLWMVHSAAVLATGLAVLAHAPGWVLPLPPAVAAVAAGAVLANGVRRWRAGHRGELAGLTAALTRHAPRFALYFSAPPGSEYQVRMWLPYLARLGAPYLVVLAERDHAAAVAAATDAPVVYVDTFEALDAVTAVPSLRAVFYVNNGMKNAHCVRLTGLTHVQLYHGDSDKAVTASPLNQLYDRVFVAGQAAVDRFAAHGVHIPPERLRIVGRPQVARLAVADRPVAETNSPVVLYAPTWVGAHADVDYCSLPLAERIVDGLLTRGAIVVLREHPYTRRDRASAERLDRAQRLLARNQEATGRAHVWGPAATVERDLFACMDAADAMVCDVSSVASDFLYTGKPFALTDMRGDGVGIADRFPVARAAYVVRPDAGNLSQALDDLLHRDPLSARRRELRTYYLGDIPPERYEHEFLAQARACFADPATDPGAVPAPATPRSPA